MILVTGATGHFGSATIDSLLEKGMEPHQITALVRDKKSIDDFKRRGVQVVIGDYDNYGSLVNAFKGIEKLLFISGSDIAQRLSQHKNIVNAAKEVGVKHIVYTSFLRKNETPTSPLWLVAKSHLQTEKWLKESGMDYTILKNNLYMDFIPAFVGEQVLETGVIYLPAQDGKISAVLRSELAQGAAKILMGSNHEGKIYDFTNTEAVSYHEIAQMISEITDKTVKYVSPTAGEYAKTMAQYNVPTDIIGLFSSFAMAQAEGELDLTSTDLEQLLERKPTSMKEFLKKVYAS